MNGGADYDRYVFKEMTVPIPRDGAEVIWRGKTVEYQTERNYSPETHQLRVTRRVNGRIDPIRPGRMFPNEMMDPFKAERINEVLAGLKDCITGYPAQYLRLIEEGLTYSDVLLIMKWYKVLPR